MARSSVRSVRPGFCHCGCGERTRVPTENDASKGWRRGVPLRWIRWHANVGRRGMRYRSSIEYWQWKTK